MLVIGITGNIGVGKSLFSSFFSEKNVPVYYSDIMGKYFMNYDEEVKNKLIKYFGKHIYKKKIIDKFFISNIIFQDIYALKFICSIIHNKIALDFNLFKDFYNKKNIPFIIRESSLLFTSGHYKTCDIIIYLNSSINKTVPRILKRNNKIDTKYILNILKYQIISKKIIKQNADIIITNNKSKFILKRKFIFIYNKLYYYGKRR